MDQDWRAFERIWRSDPGDQDALNRAITARRRAGMPVPAWLLRHQLFEARPLRSDVPLEAFVLLPDGRSLGVGHTPGTVELPEHRELWVHSPFADAARFGRAVDEVVAQRIAGLALPTTATNATLALAARAGHLVRVDLASCNDVKALAPLVELPHLARLILWRCHQLADKALEPLARASSLVHLNLLGVKKLTAKGVAHLAGLTELADLVLADCPEVGDAAVAHLARLARLTVLDLQGTAITDEGLGALAPLRELTLLNLSRCPRITAAGLVKLAPLENLAVLYVNSCGEASRRAEHVLKPVLPRCHVVAAAAS